jgi:hypothetical protein
VDGWNSGDMGIVAGQVRKVSANPFSGAKFNPNRGISPKMNPRPAHSLSQGNLRRGCDADRIAE